jgi:hypothetical protein
MEMPPPVIPHRGSGPRAALHFRTMRVGGSQIDSGTLGPAVGPDEDTAVLDLLSLLSGRVVHAVLKERPPNID